VERKKAIFIIAVLLLAAGAVAAFKFWPKRYELGQTMPQALVFWNDGDAFVFLDLSTTGRAQNIFQEKLAGTKYGYVAMFLGGYIDFVKQDVVAFHLKSTGELDRFALPERTTTSGDWSLDDGRLQLTPPAFATQPAQGFRWDGSKFVPAPPAPRSQTPSQAAANSKLEADDEDEEDRYGGLLNKTSRQEFKAAGWHYKFLSGYGSGNGTEATLPLSLAGNTYNLTTESTSLPKNGPWRFDLLSFGAREIRLSGGTLGSGMQVLWNRTGWQEVSKEDYQRLKEQYGRRRNLYQSPTQWVWLVVLAFLCLWRFGGWLHVLFTFATVKGRVLKNMATSYSFPPATLAQFPQLDIAALDRYTREFEGMGFTRLLDFSLVSDSSSYVPNFCRLFVHTRHHCFGTASQFFPKGKSPLPLKCNFESSLQNGWSLAFGDRKPQAASSLVRRRKALGVSMPEVTTAELLQAFLKMREQVCLDLGISPVNDDTLQAFIDKTQRTASEVREAVKQKSFATGLPEYYVRKLSLLKTKPEYIWLGDYPKEAEQRKKGLSSFAAGAT